MKIIKAVTYKHANYLLIIDTDCYTIDQVIYGGRDILATLSDDVLRQLDEIAFTGQI